jgi:hemoglobin-like flavoprotein
MPARPPLARPAPKFFLTVTSTEITLVKDSFRKIVPIADQAAALFYARLFELDPSLRALFRGDMTEQGRKLMAIIATAVAALERIEMIVPMVQQLGLRHVGYGVREKHYTTVGDALLWTFEKGLGPDFTPAVRDAWTRLYSLLARTMMDATRQPQPV